jgi:hypothetical protein
MDAQLWIRSPALVGTLSRAIARYSQFLKLFRLYPGTMLVPTLDIDLVWHSHQLSPGRYERDVLELAGRFVDHDDKLGEDALGKGMQRTKELWRVRFGAEYLICTCWDCEALLDEVDGKGTDADKVDVERVAAQVEFHRAVEIARREGGGLPMREKVP